ncbi:MAG: hypothetical protein ACQEUM_18275, partial [Pseudomonadota bacterium]
LSGGSMNERIRRRLVALEEHQAPGIPKVTRIVLHAPGGDFSDAYAMERRADNSGWDSRPLTDDERREYEARHHD